MQGEDGRDRVGDVLARPVRAHRVHGRVLARFWTRAFRPMGSVGDRSSGTGVILVLQRCSKTRGRVEMEARDGDAKGGRLGIVLHILGFLLDFNQPCRYWARGRGCRGG